MFLEGRGKLGRYAHVALVVAAGNANQGRIGMLSAQALRVRLQGIEQLADGGIGEGGMGQAFERGDVPPAGHRAFRGHVGGLVPVQHRRRRAQVGNFAQTAAQLVKPLVHEHSPEDVCITRSVFECPQRDLRASRLNRA